MSIITRWSRWNRTAASLAASCCLLTGFVFTSAALGEPGLAPGGTRTVEAGRAAELPWVWDSVPLFQVSPTGQSLAPQSRNGCPEEIVTHTDADFTGGTYTVQAGFAETEIAAASFVVDAADFPMIIRLTEMIFAQNHWNETTTQWSMLVWEGTPSGPADYTFSSDGIILQPLTLPYGGSQGANIAVSVDPGDPEQILLYDDGSHTFSVGYRIDQHNNQTGSGCSGGDIPADQNAFPTTDISGLDAPTENWLYGIDCGILGCPPFGGWSTFADLSILCRPSGDWVLRATYEPLDCTTAGACCLSEGACAYKNETDCTAAGGTFQGIGTSCTPNPCPQPPGACCDPERVCTDDVQQEDCQDPGYAFFTGEECSGITCPWPGACCFFDTHDCDPLTESLCTATEGFYMGHGTDCDFVDCTQPFGACCDVYGLCTNGVLESDCQGAQDTFFELQTCAEVTCPAARGACCGDGGGCLQYQEEDFCENTLGGIYAGDGTDCDDNVCDPGACCMPDGSCQDVVQAECIELGGTFQGIGTDCATAGCPQPQGACCVNENCVPDQTEANCIGFGGTWVGPFTDCGPPDPCITSATIVGAMSCRDHGLAPPIERCLDLQAVNIEPRLGGAQKLVFEVSDPVITVDASADCLVHTYTGTPTATPDGTTVTVELNPAFPDQDCCTVTLSGQVDDSFAVRILVGDADFDGNVTTADGSAVTQRLGQTASEAGARYDVDADEGITSADQSSITQRLGNVAPACP